MLSLPGGADSLQLWSAEEPHLYLLLLALTGNGSSGSSDSSNTSSSGVLEIEACQVSSGRLCVAALPGRAACLQPTASNHATAAVAYCCWQWLCPCSK
jgi:hypothetical protein